MYELFIVLIAGFGAGIITGLMGASAVIFAAPILIIFLGVNPYNAIGLSLAIDVFASIVASSVFYKNNHINVKKALRLLIVAMIFVIVGSYLAVFIPENNLAWLVGIGVLISGITMYERSDQHIPSLKGDHPLLVLLAGVIIGLIAGIFGGGGGLMILFSLVFLLRYRMHEAIGTSVVLMIGIAALGATTHYLYSPFKMSYLLLGAIGGMFGAYYASLIANSLPESVLTKTVSIILLILGAGLLINSFL